jgi:hypothetical protein
VLFEPFPIVGPASIFPPVLSGESTDSDGPAIHDTRENINRNVPGFFYD